MKKILVIYDNKLNITILEGILEKKYDIHVENNGIDAIDRVKNNDFDLIIMDIMMPDMNGIEVCKIIKENPDKSAIPVVFLSAAADDKALRHSAFDVGAVDFISKPFKGVYMIERIEAIFKNQA